MGIAPKAAHRKVAGAIFGRPEGRGGEVGDEVSQSALAALDARRNLQCDGRAARALSARVGPPW